MMSTLPTLSSLLGIRPRPRRRPRRGFHRLAGERLEQRIVLSASLGADGLLTILGSDAADTIRLAAGPNQGDVVLFGVPDVQDGAVFQKVRAVRLDALAGDDFIKIEPLALLQDAQLPNPCFDVGGGAGSDILDIGVLVGAPGYARDIDIDMGEGQNQAFIDWADGFLGQQPQETPTIRTRYISGDGDDRLALRYHGPLEVILDVQADTGGGDDAVGVKIEPTAPPQGDPIPPPPSDNPNEPPPMPSPDGIYNVLVSTGGGADDVSVNASWPDGPCVIVWNAGVDLGAGDDRLAFDVVSAAEFLTMNTAVQAGSGADDVSVNASFPGEPCVIVWNAGIDLGAGDDRLAFDVFSAAEFLTMNTAVQGGAGADDVSVNASFPIDPCAIVWNAGIDLGADADRLAFDLFSAAEFLTMNTAVQAGSGADDVRVNASAPQPCFIVWNAGIDLGNGDDVFAFNLFSAAEAVDLDLHVHGGNGADAMSARFMLDPQTQGALAAVLEGGNGDDHLELGVFGGDGLAELFGLLDGGQGFDTARATGNVLVKSVEQFSPMGQ